MKRLGLIVPLLVLFASPALAQTVVSGSKSLTANTTTGLAEITLSTDNTSTGGTLEVVITAKSANDTSVRVFTGIYELLRSDTSNDVTFGGMVNYTTHNIIFSDQMAVHAALSRSLDTTNKKMTLNVTAEVLLGSPTEITAYFVVRDLTGKSVTAL